MDDNKTQNLLSLPLESANIEDGLRSESIRGSDIHLNVPVNGSNADRKRRISVISFQAVAAAAEAAKTAAMKSQRAATKIKQKKKTAKNKRNKLSGGAIFLCFLISIAAIVLAAYLYVEVRRIDDKLMKSSNELNEKANVIAKSLLKDCAYASPWEDIRGITEVYPVPYPNGIKVYCDQDTDGGGWTVFQRRMNGKENFERTWTQYVRGFGSLDDEFWMGLEQLNKITHHSGGQYELRIDMEDFENNRTYAQYRNFWIGPNSSKYALHVGDYEGTAGDSLRYHNGMKFTTKDKDHDLIATKNCAYDHHGAWWYKSCHSSNLNGKYHGGKHRSYADGVNWRFFRGDNYSLKFVEMKFRRKI